MVDDPGDVALERLRAICQGFPEVTERLSHGAPTFFVREKKTLVSLHDNHHDDGRLAIWAPAPPGVQEAMIEEDPERFYRPPYVGHLGWVAYRLEDADWDEVRGIVEESFRKVAPTTLVRQYDESYG